MPPGSWVSIATASSASSQSGRCNCQIKTDSAGLVSRHAAEFRVQASQGVWVAETDGAAVAYARLHSSELSGRGIGSALFSQVKKDASCGFYLCGFETN